jgi:hypothetical protein
MKIGTKYYAIDYSTATVIEYTWDLTQPNLNQWMLENCFDSWEGAKEALNSKLFMAAIRRECEQIKEQYPLLDKHKVCAIVRSLHDNHLMVVLSEVKQELMFANAELATQFLEDHIETLEYHKLL